MDLFSLRNQVNSPQEQIREEKCVTNSVGTRICAVCTKLCPWSNVETEPHDFADWNGDVYQLHERAYNRMVTIMKNDWHDPAEATQQWWFDLEKHDMDSDELFASDLGKDHKAPAKESMISRIQSIRKEYTPDWRG